MNLPTNKAKTIDQRVKAKFTSQLLKLSQSINTKTNEPVDTDIQYQLTAQIADQSFKQAEVIWSLALVTLPLDLLILQLDLKLLEFLGSLPAFYPITVLCLGLSTLYLFKQPLIALINQFRQDFKSSVAGDQLLLLAMVVFLIVGMIIELIMSSKGGIISMSIQILIYGTALVSVLRNKKAFSDLDTFQIKLRRDYFLVNSLPILTTRLIAPFTIIYMTPLAGADALIYAIIILGLVLFGLLSFRPEIGYFRTTCRHCTVTIPARLFSEPLCSSCAKRAQKSTNIVKD